MNRRTLFKGLTALPLLKVWAESFDIPAEAAPQIASWKLDYDLYQLEAYHRPVRDSLPVFHAPRGGIRFIKPE